ncbi:MAG: outer membrane lipoprotein chaperone LolA [Nitrosomonadaceae bacterium]|jgi:outer membrane lipoprotein carrier protein|nr:outer membrane lipoprotein chaperone LolA [Nitrosomonadaceae bacterium]
MKITPRLSFSFRAICDALLVVAFATMALGAHAQTPTPTANVSAIDALRQFIQGTQSARGEFTQTVTDPRGKAAPPVKGTLVFQRPGKFRWVYDKPAQTIVGDGKRVWFFDQDLNQVSIRKLEAAFASTPAALLAGRAEVEAAFTLVAGGDAEGLVWVNAEPKQKDAGIERVRMGFAATDLRVMELADAFGNRTRIAFTRLDRNARVSPSDFTFVTPKGADVVGEP